MRGDSEAQGRIKLRRAFMEIVRLIGNIRKKIKSIDLHMKRNMKKANQAKMVSSLFLNRPYNGHAGCLANRFLYNIHVTCTLYRNVIIFLEFNEWR